MRSIFPRGIAIGCSRAKIAVGRMEGCCRMLQIRGEEFVMCTVRQSEMLTGRDLQVLLAGALCTTCALGWNRYTCGGEIAESNLVIPSW